MSQPSSGRAWAVTFAGTGINLCLGVLYAWSVFAKALQEQKGFTKTMTSIPYSLAAAMFAIFMVPAGRMVDRLGPRWVATIGGVLIGIGMIIAGATLSYPGLIVGFGLLCGTAMGFGYSAPTPSAVKWFQPHKKGLISGLVVSGYGLAAVYVAPLAKYLITSFGIGPAFVYLGLFFLITVVVLAQVLAFPPKGWEPLGGPPPAAAAKKGTVAKRDFGPGEMLGTAQFWALWIMYAFSASAGLMIIGHLATIAKVQGKLELGYLFTALLAIGNAGGRVVTGVVSDALGRTTTMILVFVIQALNMFAFASYKTAALLVIGSILTGAVYGALLALFPAATWDFFGLKNAGVNYGLVFTAWGAGALIGPIIAGRAIDLTKSYNLAYTISAILLLIAAVLAMVTKPPKVAETSAGAGVKA